MTCRHCGSNAGIPRKNELELDKNLEIADQLIDKHCKLVTFIGGETFLYQGWEYLVKKFINAGTKVNIITNGLLLKDNINKIVDSQLSSIAISIDGARRRHDYIRNYEGSFIRAIEAFNILNKYSIPTAAITTLNYKNFNDLYKIYKTLVNNNVRLWQIQLEIPTKLNLKHYNHYIRNEDLHHITNFIKKIREKKKIQIVASDNIGYFDKNEPYLRGYTQCLPIWQGCQAGISVCGIDSAGNVKGCLSMLSDTFVEGNIIDSTFAKIWDNCDNFSYNRKFNKSLLKGLCSKCEYANICRGGCKSYNFFSTGDLFHSEYCSRQQFESTVLNR